MSREIDRVPELLRRDSLRRHLEASAIGVHLEFDLATDDLTLITEFAERPFRREGDLISTDGAVLNLRFILRAGDRAGELRSVHLQSKRVCSLRTVGRGE